MAVVNLPSVPEQTSNRPHWTRWLGRKWARLGYARHFEPTYLEVTMHDIAVRGLPAAYEGFRLVHLTDFHGSRSVPKSYLEDAVAAANSLAPDVVALTGDFIHKGFNHVDAVADVLAALKARHGVFAVLGNHDFSVRNALGIRRHRELHSAVQTALHRRGIQMLRNRAHRLDVGGAHVHMVGVDDLWSRACDLETAFADVPEDHPRVLLAHNPLTVDRLAGRRCDVVLSGHTHGGQINLPKLGRVLLGRNGRRYAAGWYRCGESHLYVNRGVGYGVRLRYGVRPEVALLQLRRAT